MKRSILAAAATITFTSTAQAAISTYTDQASFTAVAGPVVVIETFEDAPPAALNVQLPFYTGPGGEITFVPISAFPIAPNVVLVPPGANNFGLGLNPTPTTILSASGNEHFDGLLAAPTSALGFNVFLNDLPYLVSFLSGGNVLASLTFDNPLVPGNNLAFAGITSDVPITGFRVLAIGGEAVNTGVDNIMIAAAPGAVPEPATWLMMLLGFAAIGTAFRRARPIAKAAAAG